jgi:hypothetical protein
MNKCLTISFQFVRVCTMKITSIDFEYFSNFYYFNHFNYFNHFKMIFYNRYYNNRVFRNFNTSFEINSCRCRIYHHDFFCRVFYNFFVTMIVSIIILNCVLQRIKIRIDRFDCKIKIDIV